MVRSFMKPIPAKFQHLFLQARHTIGTDDAEASVGLEARVMADWRAMRRPVAESMAPFKMACACACLLAIITGLAAFQLSSRAEVAITVANSAIFQGVR